MSIIHKTIARSVSRFLRPLICTHFIQGSGNVQVQAQPLVGNAGDPNPPSLSTKTMHRDRG